MRHQYVRRLAAVLAVSGTLVVGGCGTDPAVQDLCTNAKNLSTAVQDMSALKPDGTKVDAALAKLDQFQAVTEGRFDSAVSTLRANLDSFRQALAAASNEAFTAAAPQLTTSLKDVRSAYAALSESLATQCPAG